MLKPLSRLTLTYPKHYKERLKVCLGIMGQEEEGKKDSSSLWGESKGIV